MDGSGAVIRLDARRRLGVSGRHRVQRGAVEGAERLLAEDGASCRLAYAVGGPKPVVVLDFGRQSVGGYAVFTVTAKQGLPVVRLAYACHPDGLSETGCFTRSTSARYLGET